MSVVKINAIEVPAERADEMAERFASRAGQVEHMDGFEEFRLLRPDDGRTTWLVYTRWRDEEAFQAWVGSMAFQHGHARPAGATETQPAESTQRPGPVATSSELWSFTLEQTVG